MLAQTTALLRPRTLFALVLTTLCVTLFFSYERIKLSAFSLFQEPFIPLPVKTHQELLPLTDNEKLLYKTIFDGIGPMSYGTAHRPPVKGLPKHIIASLPDQLAPAISAKEDGHVKRLIIIGDVHGHKGPLQDLLDKLNFSTTNDALVFTGDLINKGPDSAGVVELAMKLGAHSVRGNHEDRVLLMHHALSAQSPSPTDSEAIEATRAALDQFQVKDDPEHGGQDRETAHKEYVEGERKLSKGDERARETARSLSSEQIQWLSELPVILRVGPIPRGADNPAFENLVVVHAGLVPSVPLDDQDPWAVMNMRTISHPVDELRREAVRNFLLERAKRLPGGHRGMLAAVQAVDDSLIDQELQRILLEQDPDDEMHEVSLPSSGREGTYWYEEWSRMQEKLLKKEKKQEKKEKEGRKKHRKGEDLGPITTVVYGHDAKSGLRVPKEFGKGKKGYTFGLDSGCVYGRQLTALVIEVKDDQAVYEIVQVDCDQHVVPDE